MLEPISPKPISPQSHAARVKATKPKSGSGELGQWQQITSQQIIDYEATREAIHRRFRCLQIKHIVKSQGIMEAYSQKHGHVLPPQQLGPESPHIAPRSALFSCVLAPYSLFICYCRTSCSGKGVSDGNHACISCLQSITNVIYAVFSPYI